MPVKSPSSPPALCKCRLFFWSLLPLFFMLLPFGPRVSEEKVSPDSPLKWFPLQVCLHLTMGSLRAETWSVSSPSYPQPLAHWLVHGTCSLGAPPSSSCNIIPRCVFGMLNAFCLWNQDFLPRSTGLRDLEKLPSSRYYGNRQIVAFTFSAYIQDSGHCEQGWFKKEWEKPLSAHCFWSHVSPPPAYPVKRVWKTQ